MKINTTNTTNKNKKRVAITTIICAMVVFAMVVVGCGIKKNSTVAEAEAGAEADVIATVGTTIDTTEIVEETTETIVEETTEIVEETTETVEEEPSEEPSVETPSENKPSETPSTTETPNTTPSENKPSETPNTPSTTETPSQPTTSEPTTTETPTTEEPTPQPTPNVEKHWCGTPMQMMSGYIFHPAEGYFALYVHFSNGHSVPYEDKGDGGKWIGDYMFENGVASYTIAETWVETTPEWREENVTQMCCPSCRYADNGFVAY